MVFLVVSVQAYHFESQRWSGAQTGKWIVDIRSCEIHLVSVSSLFSLFITGIVLGITSPVMVELVMWTPAANRFPAKGITIVRHSSRVILYGFSPRRSSGWRRQRPPNLLPLSLLAPIPSRQNPAPSGRVYRGMSGWWWIHHSSPPSPGRSSG